MIKYVDVEGYLNRGEIYPFSHLYQFIQKDVETPMVMLVHAYECEAKVFKGYLFNGTKTFANIPMTEEEIKSIEHAVGKLMQVDFKEVVRGTDFEDAYMGYREIPKEKGE